jgi:signal transduction histidine kinase
MPKETKLIQQTRSQLSVLAAHMGEQREMLLHRWRNATATTEGLTIAASLTRVQFNDHIPGVLDAYALTLRAWPGKGSVQSKEEEKEQVSDHGLQRWQQGYQLRELTQEWGQLQLVVMDELETYAQAHPGLLPGVMPMARRAWAHLCWNGISDSAAQYWRLHQAEANSHVRELEMALATLSNLDQARAEAWREAAHDLQGSLSVVSGASNVLDRKNVTEVMRQEFSDLLHRGVTSLHDMLNDLMSLARLDAGLEHRKVVTFDAGVLLTDFCETSQAMAKERGLYLKMEGPGSLPVQGDRTKVQRILQNLLFNALKYTQRGGVTVLWESVESHDAKDWMFCVQDTGPGLNEGPGAPMARQLYNATQTAHAGDDLHEEDKSAGDLEHAPTKPAQSSTLPANQQPGEGVGLSIVKRLCELLDASLELETSPGEGSTFRVVLPRQYNAPIE